eukprot:SAG31_NODE_2523_length_5562_cov_4.427238_6_plen_225_part_00
MHSGHNGEACYCPPELEIIEESACSDPWEPHCLAPFMLWGSTIMASVVMIIFGLICGLLSRTVRQAADPSSDDAQPSTKIFAYVLVIGLLGVYVAASIAGASMEMADLVSTFSVLTAAICVIFLGVSVGWRSLGSQMHEIPIVAKLEQARHSNMLKAIGLMVVGPLGVFWLILSFVNQLFRKVFPFTKTLDEEEAVLRLTQVGHNMFAALKDWNWTGAYRDAPT